MSLKLRRTEREIWPPVLRDADNRAVVITGGAGFVGCNLADRLLSAGRRVVIFDNVSRRGVRRNIEWLRRRHGRAFELEVADVRDREAVFSVTAGAGAVYHLAAQVAVTSSLVEPLDDFYINALGTLNVLEAVRSQDEPPALIYTSTNKVYGWLAETELRRVRLRYEPVDHALAARGIGETCRLDCRTPYGCSKGMADQYVRDFSRSYGLRTVVFRMSCIYGPRQMGTEDQGWLAHFIVSALEGQPITIYGDGRQVRDVLYIDDLVDALVLAETNARTLAGEVFNIGGGPDNTLSLLELLDVIEEIAGERPDVQFTEWRSGDQRYFVSDTRKAREALGWSPKVDVRTGIRRLYQWAVACRAGLTAVGGAGEEALAAGGIPGGVAAGS